MRKHHKKKGKKNAFASSPFVKPLTPQSYRQEERATERLQFKPLAQQLQGESRASALQQKRIGLHPGQGWFGDYQNQLSAIRNASAQQYQGAQNYYQGLQGQAGQADSAQRQALQDAAAKDAALRGVPQDTSGAQRAVEAANQRQTLGATYGGMMAQQGANQYAYLADKSRIGEGERVNQLLREQAHKRDVANQQRDLAQKKGDFRTQYRTTARDSERKYYLALQALTTKGGYNQAITKQAKLGLAGKKASAHATVKAARLSKQGKRISAGAIKSQGSGKSKRSGITNRNVARAYLKKGSYKNPRDAVNYLINRGVNPHTARTVVRHAKQGGHKKHHHRRVPRNLNPFGRG